MTVWDTKRRGEFILRAVQEQAAEGQSPKAVVLDAIVAPLTLVEHDMAQILRGEAGVIYDRVHRARGRDGVRLSEVSYDEEGVRIDRAIEQLTIPGLEDAGTRKIEHGSATILEGRRDLAIATEARRRCAAAGADVESALIGQWLTRDEIVAIRNGQEAAA